METPDPTPSTALAAVHLFPPLETLLPHRDAYTRPTSENLLGVDNDLAAIHRFLDRYRDSPYTHRNYSAEILRLWYWCTWRGATISALTVDDYQAYRAFLADPQPSADWCGPHRRRAHPEWRPFRGPLSAAARRHALTVINVLLNWWVAAQYIKANPLALARTQGADRPPTQVGIGTERWLTETEQRLLWETHEAYPQTTRRDQAHSRQLGFLLALLLETGCRIGELEGGTQGQFHEDETGWWLRVFGKGRKERDIPVSNTLLDELTALRTFHGLPPFPADDDTAPLLVPLYLVDRSGRPRAGISARQANRLLKEVTHQAAESIEVASPRLARKLRAVSAHWCRHTFTTRLLDAETPTRSIMDTTGHADPRMLAVYGHRERQKRHDDIAKALRASSISVDDPLL